MRLELIFERLGLIKRLEVVVLIRFFEWFELFIVPGLFDRFQFVEVFGFQGFGLGFRCGIGRMPGFLR